jgi:anti-anti-sigma factor
MKIETRQVDGVLLVGISGRLDSLTSGDAGDQIVAIAQGGNRRVLLDLEKLEFLTSAGMRVIIRGARLVAENQGELKICNASEHIRKLLELSGFNSLIKVYDSKSDAILAFLA